MTFGEFKNPITFSITVQFTLIFSPAVVVPIVMIFKPNVSLAGGTEINEDRFYTFNNCNHKFIAIDNSPSTLTVKFCSAVSVAFLVTLHT